MAVMPGAVWKPIAKSRAARRKGRGICLHVAVSEASSLFGYFSGATSDSHFYVRRDGTIEQYVDTDLVAYANAAGNPTLISVETQGGTVNADSEPWTSQQVDALARLCRWASVVDGFPLQPMPNSLPTSRGVGYHRLGCKPWVVAGGELWSSSVGKVCPGAGKIAQIPQVIAAARGTTPVAPQEDDVSWSDNLGSQGGIGDPTNGATAAQILWHATIQATQASAKADAIQQQLAGLQGAVNALAGAVASGRDDLTAEELRTMIHEEMVKVIDVQVTVNGAPR